jgi:hypothetical protein
MGMRIVYRLLVRKPEGKRPLGRYGWVGNIKIDLVEVGLGELDGLVWLFIGRSGVLS